MATFLLLGMQPHPLHPHAIRLCLRKSIISNFMVYQNWLETNLLQLFAHT